MKRENVLLAEYVILAAMIILSLLAYFQVFTWGYAVAGLLVLPLLYCLFQDVKNTISGGNPLARVRPEGGEREPAPKRKPAKKEKPKTFRQKFRKTLLFRMFAGSEKKKAKVDKRKVSKPSPQKPKFSISKWWTHLGLWKSIVDYASRLRPKARTSETGSSDSVGSAELANRLIALAEKFDFKPSKEADSSGEATQVIAWLDSKLSEAQQAERVSVSERSDVQLFQARHYLNESAGLLSLELPEDSSHVVVGDALIAGIQALSADLVRVQAELRDSQMQVTTLDSGKRDALARCSELTQESEQQTRQIHTLEQQLLTESGSLGKARKELEQVPILEGRCAALEETLQVVREELQAAQNSVGRLEKALARKKDLLQRLKLEAEQAAQTSAEKIAGLQRELDQKSLRLDAIQRDSGSNRKIRDLGHSPTKSPAVKKLERELSELKGEYNELLETVAVQQSELFTAVLTNLLGVSLIEELQAKIADLEERNWKLCDSESELSYLLNGLIQEFNYYDLSPRTRRGILRLSGFTFPKSPEE